MSNIITLEGYGQRSSTFRFDLLNKDLELLSDLEVQVSDSTTVDNNINRHIKRQLDGVTIPPTTLREFNLLADRIKVNMIMQNGAEFPVGVFMFAESSTVPLSGTLGDRNVTLLDQGFILDQPTPRSYGFKPGTNISSAIIRMLQGVVPMYDVEETSSQVRGSEWVTWPAGTTRLEIIYDLCALGGFYTLFFDNNGVARVILAPDLATTEATLRYGSIPGEQRVYADTIVLTDDLLQAPNRYIVVNNSLNEKSVSGYWDIPSTAPNSKENRGFVVATVIDKQGVDTNEEATAAAKAFGQSDYNTFSWATFSAAPDPRHDTFDVVSWEGVNYREQSWSLDLVEGGSHKHELRRIYNEPTFEEVV